MPGLIGFTHNQQNFSENFKLLSLMSEILFHTQNNICDDLFSDINTSGTRVHSNTIRKEKQPFFGSGVYVWLDGEFYNQKELQKEIEGTVNTDLSLFLQLYLKSLDFSFLKRIDGIFSAIIYDTNKNKIHLISDRYGFRYLYWTVFSDSLIWSSELKGMLQIPNFTPIINKESLEQFLSIGYMLENNTWFEGVSLLPSGSVLSWDLSKKEYTIQRYWWWDEIKPFNGIIDEEIIAEKLGDLFIQSIQCRYNKNKNIGLTLSGGLDSRAILAAIPGNNGSFNTITFGKLGCDDARYAKLAADVKEVKHHFFEIDEKNWILPRIQGVWWTDGQFDLMHMHGMDCCELIKQFMDINLDGFAGDLILGGSFLKKDFLDKPVNQILLKKLADNTEFNLTNYENLNKTDFFYIQNRVRRFTLQYTIMDIEQRKPFFDNKLIEFTYSLPDKFRYNHYIYNKMLLKKFPQLFEKIPWQKTGYPIGSKKIYQKLFDVKNIIVGVFFNFLQKLGITIRRNKAYTDYPDWIRHDPAKSMFFKILGNKDAIYQKYLSKEQVMSALNKHMMGKDHSKILCRYITFEIWLQQVYNKKYRTGWI